MVVWCLPLIISHKLVGEEKLLIAIHVISYCGIFYYNNTTNTAQNKNSDKLVLELFLS